jgi:hypothetical protein
MDISIIGQNSLTADETGLSLVAHIRHGTHFNQSKYRFEQAVSTFLSPRCFTSCNGAFLGIRRTKFFANFWIYRLQNIARRLA